MSDNDLLEPRQNFKLSTQEWDALGALMMPLEFGGKRTLGPKLTSKLEAAGYIERYEERIYGSGSSAIDRIPVIVKGWRQTLAGNMAYCKWAADR